jgi:hypothetical protein
MVLRFFLAVEDFGWDFGFVHQIDHLGPGKWIVAEEAVVISCLPFALAGGRGLLRL